MRQAYGPPPPESKTISAIERKGTRPEHRGAAPERQKRQERHAGEIIPPPAPLFPPMAAPSAGWERAGKTRCRKQAGRWKGRGCEGWCAWQALFGPRTQCRCALLRPPAVADSCPTKSRTVVSTDGISRCFLGEHRGQFRKCRPESILPPLSPGDMGSLPDMLEGTPRAGSPMPSGRPSLNALGPATCLQAVAPTEASSRNSLPALNAAAVVQAMQTVQCVLRKWDMADAERFNVGRQVAGIHSHR